MKSALLLWLAAPAALAGRRSPVNFVADHVKDMEKKGFIAPGLPNFDSHGTEGMTDEKVMEMKPVTRKTEMKLDEKVDEKPEKARPRLFFLGPVPFVDNI